MDATDAGHRRWEVKLTFLHEAFIVLFSIPQCSAIANPTTLQHGSGPLSHR